MCELLVSFRHGKKELILKFQQKFRLLNANLDVTGLLLERYALDTIYLFIIFTK